MQVAVSIVLPVFNVSRYLDVCLRSIEEQIHTEWECICVNDGSTDNSLEILQVWAEKDSRFKVISQKNKGLSGARNTGLRNASAEYVVFVDSDDCLLSTYLSTMISAIITNHLEILGCCYQCFPNGYTSKYEFVTNKVVDFSALLRSNEHLQSSNDLCFVWRYMFRRQFLLENNLVFDEQVRIGEDMIFMVNAVAKATRIMLIDEPLYLYRTDNNNSLMHYQGYKPALEQSFQRMYDIKLRQIAEYHIDDYTPYTQCLAEYTILQYLPMLIRNRLANSEDKKACIKAVLALPMAKHAFKVVGFRNIYPSWKEYVYYLSLKFGVISFAARYV